jgi:hypothetical protein
MVILRNILIFKRKEYSAWESHTIFPSGKIFYIMGHLKVNMPVFRLKSRIILMILFPVIVNSQSNIKYVKKSYEPGFDFSKIKVSRHFSIVDKDDFYNYGTLDTSSSKSGVICLKIGKSVQCFIQAEVKEIYVRKYSDWGDGVIISTILGICFSVIFLILINSAFK